MTTVLSRGTVTGGKQRATFFGGAEVLNFLGIGPGELLFILLLALIIFGPRRLPEIGKTLGKSIREFRQASQELTQQFQEELQAASDEIQATSDALKGDTGEDNQGVGQSAQELEG